jgi:hypothetical protein
MVGSSTCFNLHREKVVEMIKEVHEKTKQPFADTYTPPAAEAGNGIDYPVEDINPDDVPF